MNPTPNPAFDELVAKHRPAVLRVCRSILRDDHLGADAAQETFVRLWRRLAEEHAPRRFGAWLHRVAITASLDLRRRRRARTNAEATLEGETESATDRDAPEQVLASRELEESFTRALDRLPTGQRTVFLLRHSGGLTLREVADTLDVSLPTAKTQFARACVHLQESLRAYAPPPRGIPPEARS